MSHLKILYIKSRKIQRISIIVMTKTQKNQRKKVIAFLTFEGDCAAESSCQMNSFQVHSDP